MKLFVFDYLDQVSYRYHSEGGAVVVAESPDHADQIVAEYNILNESSNESGPALVLEWDQLSAAYELAGDSFPVVYVFPDAGCC